MVTKLILVRHGESLGNLENRFLGHTDLDLSPTGYKQAELIEKYFKNIDIDIIYSSDLKRAYNTVFPVSKLKNVEIITSQNLREIRAGSWETLTFNELESKFTKEYDVWKNNVGMAQCSDGESVAMLQQRVCNEIKKISQNNPGKTICIGTHATPIRVFTAKCLGVSLEEIKNIPWVSNASISTFEFSDNEFKVCEYNCVEHLEGFVTSLPKNV